MSSENNVNHPQEFSLANWWQITKRVVEKIQQDNMSLIAAGVAFYFLLAIFPLLAALISMYGLFVDQETLSQHISLLVGVIPEQSRQILEAQIESLLSTDNSVLSIGFIFSFLITLWSGGKGSVALITACNITYQEDKSRSFFKIIVVRVLLTLATILIIIVMLLLIVGIPLVLSVVSESSQTLVGWFTWPTLLIVFNFSLASLYKYAPHRESAKWRWVTPGAVLATLFWLLGSYFFNLYISEYASYNETYGSMGGVVILLMWFYVTAYTILLGAEINAATELQTIEDTTTGDEKPQGERGAYVADNGPKTE
ncbi:YihY/virulence factor BrkB family protein [Colwellia echini]|uniref:YihY/virulence factor BrkB family protein n=1 Tax=Colwellia echini TaxID=1982103 RepID=A0ABY3MZM2_9GAMM|nr:YihY/virulence factor BrkB family protein [Colwellia echini]TYK66673.1 YihY/virulence factor BrkB family protein [Colwellia echini]